MPPGFDRRRSGLTLVEMVLALAVLGIAAGFAVPRLRAAIDRVQVRGAINELQTAFTVARLAAVQRGRRTTLDVDDASGTVRVRAGADTILSRDLSEGFGVRVTSSRASLTWLPTGLAWGAANLSIVIRRGDAADTLVVSRLGRVRS